MIPFLIADLNQNKVKIKNLIKRSKIFLTRSDKYDNI